MIILHQQPDGMAPSKLAARAGVTRATISVMLRRMELRLRAGGMVQ